MKKIILLALMLATGTAYAGMAFFKYERVTGMTKQCIYESMGNEYTITISAASLCPLTLQV